MLTLIGGATRAGKSRLATHLVDKLLDCSTCLHMDDYYLKEKPKHEQTGLQNWECIEAFDVAALWKRVQEEFEKGAEHVVVEGIVAISALVPLLSDDQQRTLLFLSVSRDTCKRRRFETKKKTRNRQFYDVIWPEHVRYATKELAGEYGAVHVLDADDERASNVAWLAEKARLRVGEDPDHEQAVRLATERIEVVEPPRMPTDRVPVPPADSFAAGSVEDRALGMLMGAALGDALGVPHEFRYQKNVVYTGRLEHRPYLLTRWQGRFDGVVGEASDDTQMTLTLAHSLLDAKGRYDRDQTLLRYTEWANSGAHMIGRNTRSLLCGVRTVKGYEGRVEKQRRKEPDVTKWTQSNGALMRCSPLALLEQDERRRAAVEQDCSLTNANPYCVAINQVYTTLINRLLYGKQISDEDFGQFTELRDTAKEKGPADRDISSGNNKGWCEHGFYCALMALNGQWAADYQSGIDFIIALRGDTDTNACIAGALLGAKFGYARMCEDERTVENLKVMLNADGAEYGDLAPFALGSSRHPSCITADFVRTLVDQCRHRHESSDDEETKKRRRAFGDDADDDDSSDEHFKRRKPE